MEILRPALLAVLGVFVVLALPLKPATSAPLTEAQVRAGLLFNFATFVEWPNEQSAAQQPFVIGVVGADAVNDALREIQGRPIKGRPIEIRRIDRDAVGGGECHILYIPASADYWQEIVSDVKDQPVLTIGEHPQFTKLGGVIRLYAEESRLRFEINITRSKHANLQVSSKLLGLAKIVREP